MLQLMFRNPLVAAQHVEVLFIHWTQQILKPLEPALLALSEYFSPAALVNFFVPLVGAFNHQLLVRLVGGLAVINVLSSLFKWILPTSRPYWWTRELNTSVLMQRRLTCETSAGFPSSHCLSFTVFMYLFVLLTLPAGWRKLKLSPCRLPHACRGIVLSAVVCMAFSRIYLGTQFPHQCLVSIFMAFMLLRTFDKYSEFLYTISKCRAVMIVLAIGMVPVIVYFGLQELGEDPHWSVRMAFKWCADPMYLRHETSPIFVLCRDFGQLMGVVLSAPLYKKYENKALPARRFPAIVVFEGVNHFLRYMTPKEHGRFAFVSYEFVRNAMHSFTLLTIIPTFS